MFLGKRKTLFFLNVPKFIIVSKKKVKKLPQEDSVVQGKPVVQFVQNNKQRLSYCSLHAYTYI